MRKRPDSVISRTYHPGDRLGPAGIRRSAFLGQKKYQGESFVLADWPPREDSVRSIVYGLFDNLRQRPTAAAPPTATPAATHLRCIVAQSCQLSPRARASKRPWVR